MLVFIILYFIIWVFDWLVCCIVCLMFRYVVLNIFKYEKISLWSSKVCINNKKKKLCYIIYVMIGGWKKKIISLLL